MIYSLGIIEGIKHGLIDTNDEAFHLLFKPAVINWLKNQNFNQNLIEIFDEGREIEDVSELAPFALGELINSLYEKIINELSRLKGIEIIHNVSWFNCFLCDECKEPK